jgi:hypothetical protein
MKRWYLQRKHNFEAASLSNHGRWSKNVLGCDKLNKIQLLLPRFSGTFTTVISEWAKARLMLCGSAFAGSYLNSSSSTQTSQTLLNMYATAHLRSMECLLRLNCLLQPQFSVTFTTVKFCDSAKTRLMLCGCIFAGSHLNSSSSTQTSQTVLNMYATAHLRSMVCLLRLKY